jgi:hypothetical protein
MFFVLNKPPLLVDLFMVAAEAQQASLLLFLRRDHRTPLFSCGHRTICFEWSGTTMFLRSSRRLLCVDCIERPRLVFGSIRCRLVSGSSHHCLHGSGSARCGLHNFGLPPPSRFRDRHRFYDLGSGSTRRVPHLARSIIGLACLVASTRSFVSARSSLDRLCSSRLRLQLVSFRIICSDL